MSISDEKARPATNPLAACSHIRFVDLVNRLHQYDQAWGETVARSIQQNEEPGRLRARLAEAERAREHAHWLARQTILGAHEQISRAEARAVDADARAEDAGAEAAERGLAVRDLEQCVASLLHQLDAAEERASEYRQRLDAAELSADLAWEQGGQQEALAAMQRETDRIRARRDLLSAVEARAQEALGEVRQTVEATVAGLREFANKVPYESTEGAGRRGAVARFELPLIHLRSRVASLIGGLPSLAEREAAGELEDALADQQSGEVHPCGGECVAMADGGVSGQPPCGAYQPDETVDSMAADISWALGHLDSTLPRVKSAKATARLLQVREVLVQAVGRAGHADEIPARASAPVSDEAIAATEVAFAAVRDLGRMLKKEGQNARPRRRGR